MGHAGHGRWRAAGSWIDRDRRQRVFVADVSQRVQRFSLAGRFETGWSLYDGSVEEFPDVFDLEVDAKGDVWVVEHTQHRIRKFDADGRLLASWDRKGGGPGELQYPLAIALDGHGRVLVVEQEGRAQLFDASGRFLLQWRAAPPCGPYSSVLGVAVSRAGHIFAVDGAHHCVLDFAIPLEPTVQTWWSWGTWGSAEGSFYSPFGIDVAADGRVYVGDANARVQVFTATGEFLHQFGTPGMGEDELQSPRGIAVAGDRVHVADRAGDGAVVVYGLDGVFVDRWSIEPPPGPALVFPAGIAFDTSGNCYVTATPTRIDVFDTNGVRLRTWGVVGSAPGQFRRVSDVAVDGSGIVYVADTVNRWIGRFDADGTFRDLVADASGLAAGGIDVTPDGQVFASTGNGIRQYDADGRLLAAWGRAGSCEREFDGAGDLAVDAQGRVFVTDVGNHRVQVFVPPFTTSAKGELP
jgi:sugar lactone lactonase YvrE